MDRIFLNRINGVIKARLKGLKALLEESKQVEHASTKGTLREKYLTDFLMSFLPPNCSINGGFICDVLGNVTPQLDLIITDTSTIPTISFTGEVALVPVEAALIAVEVKSLLTSNDIEQIKRQIEAIQSLRPIPEFDVSGSFHIIMFIFAYETKLSDEELIRWLEENPNLFGICILHEKLILRAPEGIKTVSSNDWEETLVFISSLFDGIQKVKAARLPKSLLYDIQKVNEAQLPKSLLNYIQKVVESRSHQSLNSWRRYIVGVNPSELGEGN